MRSRSRLPSPTVHFFNLVDRSVPSSIASGPWYGSVRRLLREGSLGTSGGGVGGARWAEVSNRETMRVLCSCTVPAERVR